MRDIFIVLISVIIVSCTSSEIEPEIMSKTYVEILIAQEKFPKGSDSLISATQNIFDKYKISKNDYFSTIKAYEADQVKWDEFFKNSREYLDSLKSQNKIN